MKQQVVLPPDIWWLLRVPVKPGESTPMNLALWWAWQWLTPHDEVVA